MNIKDLLEIVVKNNSQSCSVCCKESKRGLTNSDGLENSLQNLGKIESLNNYGYDAYQENEENPFSESATVSLSHYPYNDGTVFQCKACSATFIIYLETGGHAARYQARWIQHDLKFMP